MATETRREAPACPQVRNACEECHSRKIKCYTTKDGGCQNCQNTGRLCFFLPRNKSGRPKADDDGTKEPKPTNPGLGTTAAAAAAAMAELAARAEASTPISQPLPQQSRTSTNSTHSPTDSSRSISQHSHGMMRPATYPRSMSDTNMGMAFPIMDTMDWTNPMFPKSASDLIEMDLDSSFQFQDLPSADTFFDAHRMNINMNSQHSHSSSYPNLETLGSQGSLPGMPSATDSNFNKPPGSDTSFFTPLLSSMSASFMLGPGEQKPPEGCGMSLLGHIYRLQRCHEKVRSGTLFSYSHTRNNQLKMVVSTIDSGCIATCSTLKDQFQAVLSQRAEAKMNGMSSMSDFRNPNAVRPDHSLIAMAITTILTIARLCQALVQSELPDPQSTLDNMLLFKRLGCNILQTRIALMNIEKLDRGLAYLTEDAMREISVVQTEFENMKNRVGNNGQAHQSFQ